MEPGSEVSIEFLARIFHAYAYALLRGLSSLSEWAQAILIRIYAERLIELLKRMGVDITKLTMEDWLRLLEEKGAVKKAYLVKID